jgi:hypothetical protein
LILNVNELIGVESKQSKYCKLAGTLTSRLLREAKKAATKAAKKKPEGAAEVSEPTPVPGHAF